MSFSTYRGPSWFASPKSTSGEARRANRVHSTTWSHSSRTCRHGEYAYEREEAQLLWLGIRGRGRPGGRARLVRARLVAAVPGRWIRSGAPAAPVRDHAAHAEGMATACLAGFLHHRRIRPSAALLSQ